MDFVKNMRIRNKLSWSFGLVVLLMALVGGLAPIADAAGGGTDRDYSR